MRWRTEGQPRSAQGRRGQPGGPEGQPPPAQGRRRQPGGTGGRPPGRKERGSMAVEFAIAVPGFLVLLLLVGAGAASDASAAADDDLKGVCVGGAPRTTPAPIGSTDFARAADVQVTVSCTVNLQAFKVIGFPVTTTFTSTAVAPLDPFVQRS